MVLRGMSFFQTPLLCLCDNRPVTFCSLPKLIPYSEIVMVTRVPERESDYHS